MFYCEDCRINKNWPGIIASSHGRCEMCKKVTDCYDIESKYLPKEETQMAKTIDQYGIRKEVEIKVISNGVITTTDGVVKHHEDLNEVFLEVATDFQKKVKKDLMFKRPCYKYEISIRRIPCDGE